jgi:hypothetical protein
MQQYKEAILDFEPPFPPLYGDVIHIPENTHFFRGYSRKYPALSNRPAYFGNQETARMYAIEPDTQLGVFKTTRPLRMLDYRFMKIILKQLFDEITKNTNLTNEDIDAIRSVIMSFGLCSLEHQIRLMINYPTEYINSLPGFKKMEDEILKPGLIEKPGIRIAETTNDALTMAFLQGLFVNQFDGFISPRLITKFHVEKNGYLPPEMVIFNPIISRIQQVNLPKTAIPTITVHDIILRTRPIVTLSINSAQTDFFMRGGAIESSKHVLDDIEEKIQEKNKFILRNYNKGLRVGKKWNSMDISIMYHIPPVPHVKGISIMNCGGPLEIL